MFDFDHEQGSAGFFGLLNRAGNNASFYRVDDLFDLQQKHGRVLGADGSVACQQTENAQANQAQAHTSHDRAANERPADASRRVGYYRVHNSHQTHAVTIIGATAGYVKSATGFTRTHFNPLLRRERAHRER